MKKIISIVLQVALILLLFIYAFFQRAEANAQRNHAERFRLEANEMHKKLLEENETCRKQLEEANKRLQAQSGSK